MSVHIGDMQRDDLRAVLLGARKEAKIFENLTEKIEAEENDIAVIDSRISSDRTSSIIIGILCPLIGLFVMIVSIIEFDSIIGTIIGLIVAVFGILILPWHKSYKKKYLHYRDQTLAEIDKLERKREAVVFDKILIIPDNYKYSLALGTMLEYLDEGLTDNWPGCVAMYKEQVHRWQVEANSEEALEMARQTMIAAQAAERNAGAAAAFAAWGAIKR